MYYVKTKNLQTGKSLADEKFYTRPEAVKYLVDYLCRLSDDNVWLDDDIVNDADVYDAVPEWYESEGVYDMDAQELIFKRSGDICNNDVWRFEITGA